MMKKFMVLAMVVAMASLASAGATLNLVDENGGDILEGDVLTIQIVENTAGMPTGFAAFGIDVEAGAYVDGSLTLSTGGLFNTFAVGADGDGFKLGGGISYIFVPKGAGEVMLALSFTAPAARDEAYAIDVTGVYSGVEQSGLSTSFVVVPEPLTLGLLSLGGLFIRRRK